VVPVSNTTINQDGQQAAAQATNDNNLLNNRQPPGQPQQDTNLTTTNSNATHNSNDNNGRSQSDNAKTKSASVSIQSRGHHRSSPKQRYAASTRDSNIALSDDDNRCQSAQRKQLISTKFVDWCTKYFMNPDNNFTSSSSSRTSNNRKDDQQREWRMLRVLSYRNVRLRELMLIDPMRFSEQVTNHKVPFVPNLVVVHPYDPIIVVAGKDDFSLVHLNGIYANNYDSQQSHHPISALTSSISSASISAGSTSLHQSTLSNLSTPSGSGPTTSSTFSSNVMSLGSTGNGNPTTINHSFSANYFHHNDNHQHSTDLIGTQSNFHTNSSHITSLQLINPQYSTLLCTGSSDGSVRVWRAYNDLDHSFCPKLITAFHLMPELQPLRQGLGMILLWDQSQSRFYATSDQNDVRIIKVWDAQSECKIQDIPTCAEFGVSCLSSDGEHSIAAGFLDGSIRIYDTRLKKTDCRTFTFRKHSEKILNLHMFKPGEKHINLVSGDSGGEVRFWDKRAPTSVKRVDVGQKMSVMSVHPNADVFAW